MAGCEIKLCLRRAVTVAGSPFMRKMLNNKDFAVDVLETVPEGYKTLVESEFAVSNFE